MIPFFNCANVRDDIHLEEEENEGDTNDVDDDEIDIHDIR